jgi:hypothetical protein
MRNVLQLIWPVFAICLVVTTTALSRVTADDEPARRSYFLRTELVSIQPEVGISSYRIHEDAGVGGFGTLDLDVSDGDREFTILLTPRMEKGRYLATLVVQPGMTDSLTPPVDRELDLSELQAQTVELVRNEDGRVYRLNLLPQVEEYPQPVEFRVARLHMEHWAFPSCPIIVNDHHYAGSLSLSGNSLGWIDISNVGLIEFSLLHLKDAQPWGTLDNGHLRIQHENGTTISMSGVENGWPERRTLPGGPYTVWVRWKESTTDPQEYVRMLRQTIADARTRAENGEPMMDMEIWQRVIERVEAGHPQMVSNGMGPVARDDLEP